MKNLLHALPRGQWGIIIMTTALIGSADAPVICCVMTGALKSALDKCSPADNSMKTRFKRFVVRLFPCLIATLRPFSAYASNYTKSSTRTHEVSLMQRDICTAVYNRCTHTAVVHAPNEYVTSIDYILRINHRHMFAL